MKVIAVIALAFLFASCGRVSSHTDKEPVAADTLAPAQGSMERAETWFLKLESNYRPALGDSISTLVINEDYCHTISDPEKAALGYVGTFIGNACAWDGKYKSDRSNLKCAILTALGLGYQCSDQHLGFLRQWFRDDKRAIKELEGCPTLPDGATIQESFDTITIQVKRNEIIITFTASGINLREKKAWSWTETDYFRFDDNSIRLVKKEASEMKHTPLKK